MSGAQILHLVIGTSYLVAATLFLLGLQRMASPRTARSGIRWAGLGMVIATVATFFLPELHNIPLIIAATAIGTAVAWISGKKVAITDMPQMVALYNGMGGGSAAAIGAVELLRYSDAGARPPQPGPQARGRTVSGARTGRNHPPEGTRGGAAGAGSRRQPGTTGTATEAAESQTAASIEGGLAFWRRRADPRIPAALQPRRLSFGCCQPYNCAM